MTSIGTGLDQLFGQIEAKIKDEEAGRWTYLVLKDVQDPQFNVKKAFPESIGISKKNEDSFYVQFKDSEAAKEASKKQLDGVTIVLPQHKKAGKRSNKGKLLVPKQSEVVVPKKKQHGWKSVKDIKILVRRHIKGLKEKAALPESSTAGEIFKREIDFLQAALRFLHSGADIVTDHVAYFEHYDEGGAINYIKKARISLETQVQERLLSIEALLQDNKSNPKHQLAMKKLKKSFYCISKLQHYFRGEQEPRLRPEILELADIKEEILSDEEAVKEEDGEEEDPEPVPAKKQKKGRYFQV